jgi:ADP-ribose pyrophosphatase YjhB (NUDIX family)
VAAEVATIRTTARVTPVGIAAHIARLRAAVGHPRRRRRTGESPAVAAIREAREEISADIELVRLLDVLGGPDYEVSYPNGDRVAYVTAVYEARIIAGTPTPGDGELSELAWFTPDELPVRPLSKFARALLHATGRL